MRSCTGEKRRAAVGSDAAPGPRAVGPSTHDGINALRGHCAEFGLIVAQGASKVEELVAIIEDPGDVRLPPLAREALGSLVEQLRSAQARIKQLEVTLLAWHRSNEASRRLATIPGVGVITATALVATIGDGAQFARADSFRPGSVWCPGSTRVAARIDWDGYRSAGMAISGACSCMVREPCCAGAAPSRARGLAGPTGSWRGGRQTWCWSPWPIRQPVVAWALLRYERIYRPTPASQLANRDQIGEGNDDLMAKQGSTRDRPNPRHCPSIKLVSLTGRRSFGFHQGQRSAYRSEKAGYMTASSTADSNQFSPCNTGGVHT